MKKAFFDWLEDRVGYREIFNKALYENIPGGSRWRYVWGSTLVFCLTIQFLTGVFLWMFYSPSSQTAWESVFHIQFETLGGWLLRGLHHYTAQVMIVLLVFHLLQVVIDGAYKAPREINFWFGWFLLQIVLALSLTGYLLPWDQKGFWATKVTTNIVANVPFVGPFLQKIIVGGPEYGHHTLTRFFALHAGVLPAAVIALVAWHIYLFRRHGITAKDPRRNPDEKFWPGQVFKDALACLLVLAVVLALIFRSRLFHLDAPLGAELTAPADASEPYSAARPEWYFLFLFQFLKYVPGQLETFGAIVLPGLAMGVLFLLPFLGRWKWGHRFNLAYLFAGLLCIGLLTYQAIHQDRHDPDYQAALREVERNGARIQVLAESPTGIPSEGAATLLRNDPYTQGPKLFAKNCASCHRFDGHDGLGNLPIETYTVTQGDTLASIAAAHRMTEEQLRSLNPLMTAPLAKDQKLNVHALPSASDLKAFATREWLTGLLDPDRITSAHYFGGTKHNDGKMVKFVKKDVAKFSAEQKENLKKILAAVSAEARLQTQRDLDQRDAALIAEGRKLIADSEMRCTECHQFQKPDEDATAPDLTGYGSREWLLGILSNPAHERYYGKRNDRMPAFGADRILDEKALGLLTDWLRGEWYEPAAVATAAR
ncbi:MAG: cytochrome b N-terminal domain-containing protein [Verrucomicrobia bacterium]|nr:cytochrome b N-terminal domain-containing protein [Verrucomicrobiota bacterium]